MCTIANTNILFKTLWIRFCLIGLLKILERSLDDKLVASRDDSTTEVPISKDSVVELEAVYNDDSTVMPNKSGVQADAVYGNVKETVQLSK
jgi:hypothetical protein